MIISGDSSFFRVFDFEILKGNSVYILIAVAFLILGIACVNFMNLATARSAERAKEVGIRKVMGSLRPSS
jgi:ABC-type lipoprotein release transport system permease subunit